MGDAGDVQLDLASDSPVTVLVVAQPPSDDPHNTFDATYRPAIAAAAKHGCSFVIGSEAVCGESRVAALLVELGVKAVTVYDNDEFPVDVVCLDEDWDTVSGFEYPSQCYGAMIKCSDLIVAYLFDNAVVSDVWYVLMRFAESKSVAGGWGHTPEAHIDLARACHRKGIPDTDEPVDWTIRSTRFYRLFAPPLPQVNEVGSA